MAPEHVSDAVLDKMGKPHHEVYVDFTKQYKKMNERLGMDQYLVPYLMSSHPGSELKDAVTLAEYIRDLGYMPEQVQDFYPTPSTLSTCMYYTGLDPRTMTPVYVPKDPHEKDMQRALIQYRDPKNYQLVKEALIKAGREDLIGFDSRCLIPPRPMQHGYGKAPAQNRNVRTDNAKNNSSRNGKFSSRNNSRNNSRKCTTENISRNTSTNRKKGSQSEKAHRRHE